MSSSSLSSLRFSSMVERERLTADETRLAIVMVGLPGRGKSFIARKIINLIKWKGRQVRLFNVGNYRRRKYGVHESKLFRAENLTTSVQRLECSNEALAEMVQWLTVTDTGAVAVFDATNSSQERRRTVMDECAKAPVDISVVFIESICDDEELLTANLRYKVTHSPDFVGMDPDEAMEMLRDRIKAYEKQYETISEECFSYIKIFNLSSKMLANKIFGRVSKTILPFIMAWNITTRPIWLVRAGAAAGVTSGSETHPSVVSKRAPLSKQGEEFGRALREFVLARWSEWDKEEREEADPDEWKKMGNHKSETPRTSSLAQVTPFCLEGDPSDFGIAPSNLPDPATLPTAQPNSSLLCMVPPNKRAARSMQPPSVKPACPTTSMQPAFATASFPTAPSLTSSSSSSRSAQPHPHPHPHPHEATAPGSPGRVGFRDTRLHKNAKRARPTVAPPVSMSELIHGCKVLASTIPRARQSLAVGGLADRAELTYYLNPLDRGTFHALSWEEIREQQSEWFEKWRADPASTRFPGGESFRDLLGRLEPCLIDIEQQVTPVLIVSHLTVIQGLLAYFEQIPIDQAHNIRVPLHSVIELIPNTHGSWTKHEEVLCSVEATGGDTYTSLEDRSRSDSLYS